MFIVTVTPIGRAIGVDTLSYFSPSPAQTGSLIEISVRKKKLLGIISEVHDVKTQKGALKKADFVLKKTDVSHIKIIFNKQYIEGLEQATKYFSTTLGALIYATCNQTLFKVLTAEKDIQSSESIESKKINATDAKPKEVHIIGGLRERCESYKKVIEDSYNKQHTFVVLCPTISHAHALHELFTPKTKQRETYKAILLAGITSAKKIKKIIEDYRDNEKTVDKKTVFIITGSSLGFPFVSPQFIIEEPDSLQYLSIARPFINFSVIGNMIAHAYTTQNTYVDSIIYGSILDPSYKKIPEICATPVYQKSKNEQGDVLGYQLLSKELVRQVEKIKKGKVFILGQRLGLATQVVCKDCATTVTCNTCGNLVRLYGAQSTKEQNDHTHNTFVCHACGAKRDAHERCKQCNSWNLKSYGVGIEKIYEEALTIFPQFDVYIASGEVLKKELWLAKWKSSTKAILIGTSAVLDAIYNDASINDSHIEHAVVANFGQLIHSPIHTSTEETIKILLKLDELCGGNTKVKSSKPYQSLSLQVIDDKSREHEIINTIVSKKLSTKKSGMVELLEQSDAEKKEMGYPPYGTLIVIEISEPLYAVRGRNGSYNREHKIALDTLEQLSEWKPTVFPITARNGKFKVTRIILKLSHEDWNEYTRDEDLASILKNLPQSCVIKINPPSLTNTY